MKRVTILAIALAGLFTSAALAQQYNLNPTGGAARPPVCRNAELKSCKDTCKQDHDDNVRLLCAKNQPGDADCKKQQTKLMSQCGDGCQKKWCG